MVFFEWKKKMWNTYTMKYYQALKNELNNVICSNMGRPRDYHNMKSDKERQISYDITYMWI